MSDIKLFDIYNKAKPIQLIGRSVALEKSLQSFMISIAENHQPRAGG